MERTLMYRITLEEKGWKLEKVLKVSLGFSVNQIRQAKFRQNGICVDGVRRRVSFLVSGGELLEVKIEEALISSAQLVPEVAEIVVLYEDEDLLIVDKPSGIPVHPSKGHYGDSLANRLVYYFQKKQEMVKVRAIGRLDIETSGIVIFAKSQMAAAKLGEQRAKGEFRKTYIALAEGIFCEKEGCICQPIGISKVKSHAMEVNCEGKFALTNYRVLEEMDGFSVVELNLQTGRTHQIRVHMAWLGHPLLGDVLYGGSQDKFKRVALHAVEVEFKHPFNGKSIFVRAEAPFMDVI
jgi:23S rRNA pseudouridine1911/1915/1917 synthase